MKLIIKVKKLASEVQLPSVVKKGDWIDLRSTKDINILPPQAQVLKKSTVKGVTTSYRDVNFMYELVPLGVAMKLPKGFEAIVVPRSSTLNRFGVIQSNSIGIIDHTYCGNEDEWKMPILGIFKSEINVGDRVCQFRIQLSQKANIWHKIKWFFSSGIKIKEVENLEDSNRGGFGSTGVN